MILAGELAFPDDVACFRAQAESAGNLEHQGQHYYSMKRIEGGSLGTVIEDWRTPPLPL